MRLFRRLFAVALLIGTTASLALAVADRRFDITTFNCTPEGSPDHFCEAQFDSLNWSTANGHFLAMGTDNRRADVNAAGNFLAAYYNDLTGLYGTYTGAQAADQIEQYVLTNFTNTGVKTKWVILNEISAGLWPSNAGYRAWLRTLVARLNNVYAHEVILFSPFSSPGANGADWVPLSVNCYIAIEKYLSGAAVNANGNSVAWCAAQYQASKNAYINLGVGASRLYLAEHFAQTVAGTAWGRSGVSYAGWDNAIKARADGAKQVGFAGFVGYAWGKNAMGVSEADMVHFQNTYRAKVLP
jgi:hypothetical protein